MIFDGALINLTMSMVAVAVAVGGHAASVGVVVGTFVAALLAVVSIHVGHRTECELNKSLRLGRTKG